MFFWGLHQIPGKVVEGQLDRFLSRPISPLVGLLGEEIHLEALYEIVAGVFSLVLVCAVYSLWPDFGDLLAALAALVAGTLILVLVHGVISLSSFWFGRLEALQSIVDEMDDFQKYPLSFYPRNFRWFLIFVLPLYFPGAFAAKLYLGMEVEARMWLFLGCLALFLILYRRCLAHYEANG